ncbi:hypothetical protein DF044_38470 [Burkholderia contaminans]|uniref:hypothetical protein n=1 Tax=Burkholderia contaminans TaxID=488447 RepID=UPI000F5A82C5|nr:hypothetical protein [Burkholderia contaminans]RQT01769.1 hypothetical protein DF044_38470 [Burkholderia contaminans]
MSCYYNEIEFRTKLLAQWAAFFDLAGWTWQVNPAPVGDWLPDFAVRFPCGHSECPDEHSLLVSVLPVSEIEAMSGHPALQHRYSVDDASGKSRAHAGALFGVTPTASAWEMAHGAGGGHDNVPFWVSNWQELWRRAATLLRTQ